MSVKVGVLTCTNSIQDLDCCGVGCIADANNSTGMFSQYADSGGSELIGFISCAGCPTAAAPEKILRRVKTLSEMGAEAIHISSCMEMLCPFKSKYKSIIQDNFPKMKVVVGTHDSPGDPKKAKEMFRGGVKECLCQPKQNMVDLIKMAQQMMAAQQQ